MSYETLLTSLEDGVARITLNRPQVRNALSPTMLQELLTALALSERTTALARRLAGFSPAALGLAKEAAATIQDMEYGKSLRYLKELLTLIALSDDAREGIAAFFDKRDPQWKGR